MISKMLSDGGSTEEIFVDALEVPIMPDVIPLELSISEARVSLDLFLSNRFSEARNRTKPHSSKSMYHALAVATLYFMEASSTLEQEHFSEASLHIKTANTVCSNFRQKSNGLLSFGSSKVYSELEAHAELGYAESLLELALINIMRDEKMVTFFQSSLKVRECYYCYKHCTQFMHKIQWSSQLLRREFECGVYFGLGAFNLVISLLPQRFLRLLEFVGFSGDKDLGLSLLKKASSMTNCLRSPICGLMLLMYYNYLSHILNMDREEDQIESDLLLKIWLEKYKTSALFLFFAGRFSMVSYNIDQAISLFQQSLEAQNDWKNYHQICFWELMWCHAIQGKWLLAIKFAERLACESRWSQVLYRYLKAAFILQLLSDDDNFRTSENSKHELLDDATRKAFRQQVKDLMQSLPGLMQRIAGKSVPMEKFAVKKSERFFEQNAYLAIPALEIIFVFNAFKLLKQNKEALLYFLHICNASVTYTTSTSKSADDLNLAKFVSGLCNFHLGRINEAQHIFLGIIDNKDSLVHDTYLAPYASIELIHICLAKNMIPEAEKLLERTYEYKKYSLENRLHFKMHALKTSIDQLKNPHKVKPDWWQPNAANLAEALEQQFIDDESASYTPRSSPIPSHSNDQRSSERSSKSKRSQLSLLLRSPSRSIRNLRRRSRSDSLLKSFKEEPKQS